MKQSHGIRCILLRLPKSKTRLMILKHVTTFSLLVHYFLSCWQCTYISLRVIMESSVHLCVQGLKVSTPYLSVWIIRYPDLTWGNLHCVWAICLPCHRECHSGGRGQWWGHRSHVTGHRVATQLTGQSGHVWWWDRPMSWDWPIADRLIWTHPNKPLSLFIVGHERKCMIWCDWIMFIMKVFASNKGCKPIEIHIWSILD